jgi:hypothetical protein
MQHIVYFFFLLLAVDIRSSHPAVDGTSPEPTTAAADMKTPATAEAAAESSLADLLAEDYNAAYPDYYYGGEGTYPPEYYDELGAGGTTFAPEDEQRDELAPLAEEIVPELHNSLQPGGAYFSALKDQYEKIELQQYVTTLHFRPHSCPSSRICPSVVPCVLCL